MNDLDTLADVFRGLKPWRGVVPAGHRANFLGVMTALAYFHEVELRDFDYLERARAGDYDTVTRAPEVGDGERYFEWVNTVEAARLAQDRFVLVEAGGGFGARSVDAHAALQMLNPLPETYVVVEAVLQHMEWARQHFAANGLYPAQHWFINALINDTGRPELFAHAPGVYFSNIIDTATRQRVFDAAESEGVLDAVLRNLMVEGRMGSLSRLRARTTPRWRWISSARSGLKRYLRRCPRSICSILISSSRKSAWCLMPSR